MDLNTVAASVSANESNFDSSTSSPYITAPSSPNRFGNHLSHPSSFSSVQYLNIINSRSSSGYDSKEDFKFDISGRLGEDSSSLSAADELFQEGKIRPLKPLPACGPTTAISSPISQKSENEKCIIEESEKLRSETFVPCSARKPKLSVYSLVSIFWFGGGAYKKWKYKDLLSTCDPLSSSDSSITENIGSSISRVKKPRDVPNLAHKLHYAENRTVSEEQKRKSFLPYKQGLLGCFGFTPVVRGISRSGSLTRGRSSSVI